MAPPLISILVVCGGSVDEWRGLLRKAAHRVREANLFCDVGFESVPLLARPAVRCAYPGRPAGPASSGTPSVR
jgi:hypothetical protein